MPSPVTTPNWQSLRAHADMVRDVHLRELFARDPDRFAKFSLRLDDFLLDYSKNRILPDTMTLLFALARAAMVEDWRDRMFRGDKINVTENRAVLHVALRAPADAVIKFDGQDVMPAVRAVQEQMRRFSSKSAMAAGVARRAN